jgi:hypothetical protein
VTTVTVVVAAVLDLYCLLLLPTRLAGHLVPAGPLLVLVVNVALGTVATRLARSRAPARWVIAVALALSVMAAGSGPGGDLLVTRDLQWMYLLYVAAAVLGAGIPLFRRTRPSPEATTPPS